MTTRSQRNRDYARTGAPALQDGDPEPPDRMPRSYWRVVSFLAALSVLLILAGLALRLMGL